ncbi:MAG TPA: amidohydrolase family protein [Bacteroidia bacterium]|nr:amidohydrolase family protein [Bacteroidia bacterium]
MKKILTLLLIAIVIRSSAQVTFPVNGVTDERKIPYAFINGRIIIDSETTIDKGTLLILEGRIVSVGTNVKIPQGASIIDLKGKSVYPSFIDPYTDLGMPEIKGQENNQGTQLQTLTQGAYAWNQAIRPETEARLLFKRDPLKSDSLRKAGFGVAMTLYRDGIARGTSAIVTLGTEKENKLFIREKAGTCYSFDKGTSRQEYPTSEMGAIALLRQTELDAKWYASQKNYPEHNISLEAWNETIALPRFFESGGRMQSIRCAKIADEFGFKYIIKGSGDEYRRVAEIKNTGSSFILPLNFPEPYDVTDPYDALNISLQDLKHWEMAPANPAILYHAGVPFAFTSMGLKDPVQFVNAVRKTIEAGLPENIALEACTRSAAQLLGIDKIAGSLKPGMLADFLITSGKIFNDSTVILENWVAGKRFVINDIPSADVRGLYEVTIKPFAPFQLHINGNPWKLISYITEDTSKTKADVTWENGTLLIRYNKMKGSDKGKHVLTGYATSSGKFSGTGIDSAGTPISWSAVRISENVDILPGDTASSADIPEGKVWFPDKAFGFDTLPTPQTVLFRNVTVWTNEAEGVLKNYDVLIENGKIAAIGQNLNAAGAKIIDGTGKHLTPGIIDEHSHIAISGDVNECSHSVTAEVRIGDVIDPDDINIYRQLSGGVTTSQLLHGSCNPIGGQSAIVKLRWGRNAEEMKFAGAPGFIKFALGENVKQSNWGEKYTVRYPQSRMGVEQVYVDAFNRARNYQQEWKQYGNGGKGKTAPRRDLQLETLAEILNSTRFVTCHSYEQSEINMLMHVADTFGFHINTFTHILEGYKVADKMKAHGAGASTFSDWWAYKFEVMEAIPYNGSILHDMGITTAYNSDDAEMARRLNQEAAKAVKYGGVSEEEALKFVTLNPAKLLHIDQKVGSIKVGKDADVVLWTDNPLSVYAKVVQTYIDGTLYFDMERDSLLRASVESERGRLIAKMAAVKNNIPKTGLKRPPYKPEFLHHCIDDIDQ